MSPYPILSSAVAKVSRELVLLKSFLQNSGSNSYMLQGQVQFVSVQLSPRYDQWLGATAELLLCVL